LSLCAAAIFFVTRAFGFFVSVDRFVRIDPPRETSGAPM